jgi:hypothetical protein
MGLFAAAEAAAKEAVQTEAPAGESPVAGDYAELEGADPAALKREAGKKLYGEVLEEIADGYGAEFIQGELLAAGTSEDNIKYSWNYAILLAKGPVPEALVPAPVKLKAERLGGIWKEYYESRTVL